MTIDSDEKILTTTGWKLVSEIEMGDCLVGELGSKHPVTDYGNLSAGIIENILDAEVIE